MANKKVMSLPTVGRSDTLTRAAYLSVRRKDTIFHLLLIAIVVALVGCAIIPGDITTSNAVVESGWKKGSIYETVKPVFLVHDEYNKRYYVARSNADHLRTKLAHQCGSTIVPRSISEYENNQDDWRHIEKVLPIGSKIRFEQAYNLGGLDAGLNSLVLRGVLLGAVPLSVYLDCIAIVDYKSKRLLRDSAWLKE
ncbi:MAG: hypothetical protein ABW096_00610 [Candidatus Thiodiazotropha sp.]